MGGGAKIAGIRGSGTGEDKNCSEGSCDEVATKIGLHGMLSLRYGTRPNLHGSAVRRLDAAEGHGADAQR
jgi:hypothetical protein